jgi:hypothetical protein
MVIESGNKRYGKAVPIGLAGQGAFGNMLAMGVNKGTITSKQAQSLLRYRKMLANKNKK